MTGRWVSLQAQPLDRDPGRVVATLAPSTPHTVIPAYALWSGLTPRETQLLNLIVGGDSTKTLALALGLSRYTVEDHLRSIYRKTHRRPRRPPQRTSNGLLNRPSMPALFVQVRACRSNKTVSYVEFVGTGHSRDEGAVIPLPVGALQRPDLPVVRISQNRYRAVVCG